jgi:hypothetical protein
MRAQRLRLELRVELHGEEPRVVGVLDDFGQAFLGVVAEKTSPLSSRRLR